MLIYACESENLRRVLSDHLRHASFIVIVMNFETKKLSFLVSVCVANGFGVTDHSNLALVKP